MAMEPFSVASLNSLFKINMPGIIPFPFILKNCIFNHSFTDFLQGVEPEI